MYCELSEGLTECVGATLQHLQLVIWDPNEAEVYWRSLRACSELAALQLAFMPDRAQAADQQVPPDCETRLY